MSKLVPLLHEGADDLERTLLAAARNDGPPNAVARTRTLAALKAASRTTAAVAGAGAGAAGWRWFHLLKPAALPWLAAGGLGVAVTLGGGVLLGWREKPGQELSSPAAASSPRAPAPSLVAASPVAPSPRASAPPSAAASARAAPSAVPSGRRAVTLEARSPSALAVPAPARPAESQRTPAPAVASASHLHSDEGANEAAPIGTAADGAPQGSTPAPTAGLARTGGIPDVGAPPPSPPPPPAPPSSLHLEASLLESVRESLAASRVDRALASLDEYDARFASGVLAEEAAVLRVEALLASGRRDEARRVTADFERKHPASSYVRRLRARVDAK